MKQCNWLLGWIIACVVVVWRASCRYRIVADPRAALRAAGQPYVYALLHAHQVAGVFCSDEPRLAAMVSRSTDGDLLVPSLRLRGITPVRGSARRAATDKGGRQALATLARMAAAGVPALLAVDGPRGPRNRVHRGAIHLAQQTEGVILPVVVLPNRRWILSRTWDRMQLPKPFSRITLVFGAPITATPGRTNEALRCATQLALHDLEFCYDPDESTGVKGPSTP